MRKMRIRQYMILLVMALLITCTGGCRHNGERTVAVNSTGKTLTAEVTRYGGFTNGYGKITADPGEKIVLRVEMAKGSSFRFRFSTVSGTRYDHTFTKSNVEEFSLTPGEYDFTLTTEPDSAGTVSIEAVSLPVIETTINEITRYGNITLDVPPSEMIDAGYEIADVISVSFGDLAEIHMPIGTEYSNVDVGMPICRFRLKSSDAPDVVVLAINMGDLATAIGLAKKENTEDQTGFQWNFAEGYNMDIPIYIQIIKKNGYHDGYFKHHMLQTRSDSRADYPKLSDPEYANFREVHSSGMRRFTLYRSSSPIDPAHSRNTFADAALFSSGIKTVVNTADTQAEAEAFPGFADTHYAQCDVIYLNMNMDFYSEDFKNKLAEGYRFIIEHEGPYLIHCGEGSDRTAFAVAILECLTGATRQEIIDDYMRTYHNFYGVATGTQQYSQIASSNIELALAISFNVPGIDRTDINLVQCAEEYLKEIGLTAGEIGQLKQIFSVGERKPSERE